MTKSAKRPINRGNFATEHMNIIISLLFFLLFFHKSTQFTDCLEDTCYGPYDGQSLLDIFELDEEKMTNLGNE